MQNWFPTSLQGVRYHLSEYGPRNRPTNARELYNLRHSSLRVTVERGIGALKGRFRILDNKPFHKYVAMRWTNTTSGFVLRRMAALVSEGSMPDKVFKDKDVNAVAKTLK
jgi:hypothetical protein